ncbi:MAG: CoA-binding protein, partial [Candidatus Paceibacterota bacterium]
MSKEKIKKLNRIFNPKTIAIVGASDKEGSVGYGLVKNIQDGNNTRTVFLINPFIKEIFGTKTYSDITKVKRSIDLVVIAVPAPIVLEIVRQCVKVKAGGIIIIASGFGESGEEGKGLEKNIVETCVKAGIPLIGPNCLGIMNTSEQLNASFAPLDPRKGNIAFLSQSGAMVDAVLDRCANENFGFSKIVSYGNEADCGLIDFLEYLKTDKQTKAIIVYFEGVADGRGFMEMARAVSKIKPIIAIKAGRGEAGQKAASTHTGSLSTGYEVYRAALKQSGVIQVDSLDALLDSARAFSFQNRINNG